MCSGTNSCLFLLDPVSGADRSARTHLRPWLTAHGLIDDEVQDVLTAVSEAVASVVSAERTMDRAQPIQVSAELDVDALGARGVALRVVDQGTLPIARGPGLNRVDYGQLMMRGAMDEVNTQRDPHGGIVITMRTRPLRRRSYRSAAS